MANLGIRNKYGNSIIILSISSLLANMSYMHVSPTIIIGYGYSCAIDLSKFCSTLRVIKFNLKVFIFLWCHVINDRDLNVLQCLEWKRKMGSLIIIMIHFIFNKNQS